MTTATLEMVRFQHARGHESDARPLRTQAGIRNPAGRIATQPRVSEDADRHGIDGSDLPLHANVFSHLRSHCGTDGSPQKPQTVSYLSTVTKGSQASSQQCDLHAPNSGSIFGWASFSMSSLPGCPSYVTLP